MSPKPLWHGRIGGKPAEILWRFTADPIDRRLLEVDVAGSLGHVAMLEEVGLVSAEEGAALTAGLETIHTEAVAGSFSWVESDEDVHTAVERRLGELIGEAAGKLHTGRSRNDQIALDLRLYLRQEAQQRVIELEALVAVLADQAERNADVIVASYTHLQQAQAISLGHHLMAYASMALRDAGRFRDAAVRLDVSPLGAGASAGSSLPLDTESVAGALGFGAAFTNSMDAVGSRDLAAEYVFVCAQAMTHLSRLGEDLVLWASEEFGWVVFPDELTTGSSALPQKKNPDIAELVRGRSATVIGDVTTLLALQKGLPLTYNRDLQEDKRAVFHADDVLAGSLEALVALVTGAVFDPPLPGPWVGALDLAETLVERGVPFREAHAAVGALVAELITQGRTLQGVTETELTAAHEMFTPADLDGIDPTASAAARRTAGGGSPASVRIQVAAVRAALARTSGS